MAGASVWNNAGTWEERDVSKWATSDLTDRFLKVNTNNGEQSVKVTKISNCTGEALITFPRGKKRCGYEFEAVQLELEATVDGKSISITATLPYVCDDVDDHEYEVKYSVRDPSLEGKLKPHLSAHTTPALRQAIVNFAEALALQ